MNIINLGILAHIDAGKTSVTENLLFASGATEKWVVFQKVCLGRRLQILQICKYSDSCFQIHTPRRVVLIFVL